MEEKKNGRFNINTNYVFDGEFEQLKDSFLFKARNSYFGWHYLRNAVSMVDFTRRRK